MDPKKMLTRPEKTAEADERKAAAEAAEAAEEKELQEHYEHADSLLRAAEKDPEKVKAAGEKIGVDYSFIADHATAMKGGLKKYAGKPLSEKEESALAEQGSFLKKVIEADIRKDFQEESPEERAKTVNLVKKVLRRFSPEFQERALKAFNMVDSDAPSEAAEENDKEKA